MATCKQGGNFKFLYPLQKSIKVRKLLCLQCWTQELSENEHVDALQEKIEIIAKEMYGAASVEYLPKVGLWGTSISPCALEATVTWQIFKSSTRFWHA